MVNLHYRKREISHFLFMVILSLVHIWKIHWKSFSYIRNLIISSISLFSFYLFTQSFPFGFMPLTFFLRRFIIICISLKALILIIFYDIFFIRLSRGSQFPFISLKIVWLIFRELFRSFYIGFFINNKKLIFLFTFERIILFSIDTIEIEILWPRSFWFCRIWGILGLTPASFWSGLSSAHHLL